jgi:hypothetical protein
MVNNNETCIVLAFLPNNISDLHVKIANIQDCVYIKEGKLKLNIEGLSAAINEMSYLALNEDNETKPDRKGAENWMIDYAKNYLTLKPEHRMTSIKMQEYMIAKYNITPNAAKSIYNKHRIDEMKKGGRRSE